MKKLFLFLLFAAATFAVASAAETAGKTRVLIFTGGHGFEKEPFFKLFQDNPDITFKAAEHPNAQALLSADAAKDWDVLVLYDLYQPISDETKSNFVARLQEGKGLVVLHHAIANYQTWPEYNNIIGAHYYLAKTNINGVYKLRAAYKHGVTFNISVADTNHPITKGIQDFGIVDETYNWFDVYADVHPLLTTTEPESAVVIAWAKNYANARVVYLQSGHDHTAYENPNFQRILRQSIQWVARKESPTP